MPNYPCSVCLRNVNNNHRAICCDICDRWVHIRCNLLDEKYYNKIKNDPKQLFYCISCIKDNMPFTKLSDPEYYAVVKKGVVFSDEVIKNNRLSALSCKDYIDKLNSYIANSTSQNGNEDDFSLPPTDCKYYSIDDFADAKFKAKKGNINFPPQYTLY